MQEATCEKLVSPKITAIIVLYFPNENSLDKLLKSIQSFVSNIYVVDNTPGKTVWLSDSWFLHKNFNVTYLPLGDNYGIAKAQNVGITHAIDNSCDHVILFDQDSVVPPDMIEKLLEAELALLADGVNVGAVGPVYIDEKTGVLAKAIRFGNFFPDFASVSNADLKPVRADVLIASGSLIRTDVLKKIGLKREDLFIDAVDVEWSLRAGYHGYQHYVIPKTVMVHNMGYSYVKIAGRKIILHNDIRHFYSIRNYTYLALDPMMGRRFRVNAFIKIPLYIFIYSLTSKSPFATFKLLFRACMNGLSGKLGKAF